MYQVMVLWEGKIQIFPIVKLFHKWPFFISNKILYLFSARSDLEVVLTSMFNNLLHQQGPELKQIEVFINAANLTTDSVSFEDFQKWCAILPAARKYLSSLLMPSDSGY